MEEFAVVVIGAGIAGLSAARALAEEGERVVVLESRDRAGGRLLTVHEPSLDLPVELGAEFVHGRPQELLDLIAEAGLSLLELDGEDFCWQKGRLGRCEQEEDAMTTLGEMEHHRGPDISFASYLRSKDLSPEAKRRVIGYVEGFNAADANDIGIHGLVRQQLAEDEIEGGRLFRVREGYDALAQYLCGRVEKAGGVIRLSTPVVEVKWQPGSATVTARSGASWQAKRVIVAVPLGVLHAGTISFAPAPEASLAAAQGLAMGTVQRLVLNFRDRFWARWPEVAKLGFLLTESGIPATWWTPYPSNAPTLTGWVGGPKARRVSGAEALLASGLEELSRCFSMSIDAIRRELRSWHMHDWQNDPWSLGAYSYPRVGGLYASDELATPVEDTLFFAGEHADTSGHWGTVHGAYRSGLRAAGQVLGKQAVSRRGRKRESLV